MATSTIPTDSTPEDWQKLFADWPQPLLDGLLEEEPHWAEWPPTIQQFIEHEAYLGMRGKVSDAVLNTLTEAFDPEAGYSEIAACWGIGTGKSFATSIALSYLAYRLLCLNDPQDYYGLAPGSEIAVVNFSINATQAKRVVFGEVLARINHAPCFKQKGFQRNPKINSELRWPDKNIIIFPGNSQAESAIGYNVLAAAMDEAAFLPDVEKTGRVAGRASAGHYDAAEELYRALHSRLTSRGGNWRWIRDGLLLMISSPCHVDDFMERKLLEAKTASHIYATRVPTWKGWVKQRLSGKTFLDPVLGPVPVEYEYDFKVRPEMARRDLGAVPCEALQGYFTEMGKVEEAKDATLPDLMQGIYLREGIEFGPEPRFVHIDLGISHDRAGFAVAHWNGQKLVFDILTYFEAADFESGEVDLEHIRELLFAMRNAGCRFSVVSYDGFQSVDSRQLLKKAHIPSEYLSVDKTTQPYDDLKELLYNGQVAIPATDRSEMFWQEARRLELVKGKKIDHPVRGSKDVSDAAAGAATHAVVRLGLRTPDINRMKEARGDASSSLTGTNATTGEETNLPDSKDAPDVTAVFGTAATDVTPTVLETMYPAFKSFRRKQPPPS